MPAEFTGWRKLAEFMAHHVFSDKYRYVDFAVVDGNSAPHKLRGNSTSSGPCLNNSAVFSTKCSDFLSKFGVYKRSFFQRSRHFQAPHLCLSLLWSQMPPQQ